MSGVDSRIVTMKFENGQFELSIGKTLTSLDKLKSSLKLEGATKGLDGVSAATSRFNMAGVSNQVQGVSKSFLALSTIAVTALATVTAKAVDAGLSMAKSLSISPIIDGLHEYETNLNSIQTILANTQASGADLNDVNNALNQLNTYSDKTIYNFSEMARNIGTFTAAGVDLDTSVQSIKGIANLAALSGSNSQQAATAMYQLSQAISAGRVGLQDWNSVVNAGMGGTVFQRALATTAQSMGTLADGSVKLSGKMKNATINGQSFRESITAKPGEKSWLTSKVLTNTLKQFTGDLSKADLKAQGFNDSQIKAIQQTAKTAQAAATQVKTLGQLMDVAKETVGSGWAKTFQLIFGNFDQAKKTFTSASNTVNGLINQMSNARNNLLQGWSKLGGRDVLIDAIGIAFRNILIVMKAVKMAFQSIFPPATAKGLLDITVGFATLLEKMKPSGDTVLKLQRIFAGLFAILDVAVQIVKGIARGFNEMFSSVSDGQGGFLELIATIGDLLVAFDKWLKKNDIIGKFFEGLGAILAVPLQLLGALATLLVAAFSGFDPGKMDAVGESFGRIGDRLGPIEALFKGVVHFLGSVMDAVAPLAAGIGAAFSDLGDSIGNAMASGDFSKVFDVLNAVLFGGILLLVKKFFSKGINIDIGGGIFGQVKDTFGQLTGTLSAMQSQIQSKTLLRIAAAVALITVSVVALSLIDSKALTKALAAISVGFAQLLGAMAILTKVSGSAGFIKIPLIAASLNLLAGAILILSASVVVLSRLSWEELSKGLAGVAALLIGVSLAVKPLSASSGGMVRVGLGLVAVGIGIRILAESVEAFSKMKWKDIGKGLAGMAGALVLVTAAVNLMPPSIAIIGPGLVIFAAGVLILSQALEAFGSMSWEEIAKGVVALAGALALVIAAVILIPPTIVLIGPALIAVAVAIEIIAVALQSMGSMSWEEIAKSMVALAGSLAILAAALYLMTGAIVGAAALVIAAGALAVMVPVLIALGNMSWSEIAKGLTALAGAFVVIGLAGLILTPLIPSLLGLGLALTLIGAGLALAGAGALAFATAFTLFVAAGTAGLAVVGALIGLVPAFAISLAKGIIAFAVTITKGASTIVDAIVELLGKLFDGLAKLLPKFGNLMTKLIQTMIRVLRDNVPGLINTAFFLLDKFLAALDKNVPKIVDTATSIIVKFIDGISRGLPKIIDAGARMIIRFINGVADAIRNHADELNDATNNLGLSIVQGVAGGITSNLGVIKDAAIAAAKSALDGAKNFLGINSPSKVFREVVGKSIPEGMAVGIDKYGHIARTSAEGMGQDVLDTVKHTIRRAGEAAAIDISSSPVITPVLDLSQLARDASQIDGMMGKPSINANVTRANARDISSEREARRVTSDEASAELMREIKFTQNNYSPKALSPVAIYRQTRNQLSLAKGVLNV